MKEQELIVYKNEDNGVTYYQHECYICVKDTRRRNSWKLFDCNTTENRCRSISQHYCNGCDEPVCFFHSSFVRSDNYCLSCIGIMIAHIRELYK